MMMIDCVDDDGDDDDDDDYATSGELGCLACCSMLYVALMMMMMYSYVYLGSTVEREDKLTYTYKHKYTQAHILRHFYKQTRTTRRLPW